MAIASEPRRQTLGKCAVCGLAVREGEDVRDVLDNLTHRDCDEVNKRELAAWNAAVKADKKK